jgi:hypothetical protein
VGITGAKTEVAHYFSSPGDAQDDFASTGTDLHQLDAAGGQQPKLTNGVADKKQCLAPREIAFLGSRDYVGGFSGAKIGENRRALHSKQFVVHNRGGRTAPGFSA